jgi:hypothetical protein
MRASTIGLAGAAIIATAVITFMTLMRIGIRYLERSGSQTGRPRNLSVALARRVLDLPAFPQADVQCRAADPSRSSTDSRQGKP